jgi:cytochrome c-type protein NapB
MGASVAAAGVRVAAGEVRDDLRAFEGAPPVVPHPTFDLNVETCRACHEKGLRAGDKLAGMLRHVPLTNCVQCHVERDRSPLGPAVVATAGLGR